MAKGSDGILTINTEPLEPTVHLYWFNLDGQATADPINPAIKLRQRTSASLVEVPGAQPALWDVRDVPHGSVVTDWHKSIVLNRNERIIVYLPPGYEKGNTRYPILYLVHGSGDIQESWVQVGHANLILDSLIAEGKAKPMIVVMPAGHSVPFTAGRGPVSNNDLFEQYLLKEVIPTVEGKYRVAPGARNRAMAGLSMGGGHTIQTGFSHPDMFSALGVFSSAPQGDAFQTKYKSVLSDAKGFNAKVTTVWLAGGDIDPVYPRMKAFSDTLEKAGIHAPLKTYKGAHTWPVWRYSLSDFAPLLFSGKK
jgi:enterochelin esterase family protein